MGGLLVLAFAIYLLTRKKGDNPTQLPEVTPGGGTTDPTGNGADYVVKFEEVENYAWTWTKRPDIFTEVPLSPGSRDRWFKISDYWRANRMAWVERHILEREIQEYQRERRGNYDAGPEYRELVKRMNENAAEANRLAQVQREAERAYKAALLQKFSPSQVAAFYQERKDQILEGIWPLNETYIVDLNNDPGAGPGTENNLGPKF